MKTKFDAKDVQEYLEKFIPEFHMFDQFYYTTTPDGDLVVYGTDPFNHSEWVPLAGEGLDKDLSNQDFEILKNTFSKR